ncbi:MAG: glycosyltransferase family 2 protein [Clostridia bacterium]|nr:glycosyltransferase family 2 protein [Clostridia bacterium]
MGNYMVSGCIVTHNNMTTIAKTLDSLREFTSPENFKLYIVDNDSTDGTPDFIAENYPEFELIRNPAGNTGFGTGHNVVLPILNSKYHVVINPDIILRDDVITEMTSYLDENDDIGLLAPKICFPDGRMQVLGKRNPKIKYLVASRLRQEGSPSKLLSEYAMLDADYTKPFDIENASGCFFVIRTELYKQIKGFDENIFLYFEDCDITRRVNEVSRAVFYPYATVYHEWGRESKKNLRLMLVQIKSMFYYFRKWR